MNLRPLAFIKSGFWTRTISLGVMTTFVFPYLTWAFEGGSYLGGSVIRLQETALEFPKKFGTLQSWHPGRNRTIIHIQDLHCNYEVQKNIAALLGILAKQHGLKLVGEEGAFDTVRVSQIRTFPDLAARNAVADHLVRQGQLTGAEWAAATGPDSLLLEGIESPDLYEASLRSVRAFLNDESQGICFDLRASVQEVKSKVFHTPLKTFDAGRQAFREGRSTLLEYAAHLFRAAKRGRIETGAYAELGRYLIAGREQFPEGVEAEPLFQQADALDQEVRRRLYSSAVQSEADAWDRRIDILERLVNISASPADLKEFREHRSQFTFSAYAAFVQKMDPEQTEYLDPAWGALDEYLTQAEAFYRTADLRSRAFVDNVESKMNRLHQDLAVMITGGFHTAEVLEELKRRQFTTVSVKPRLTRQDIANPYFSLLQKRRTPLEKLLAKNQNILATRTLCPDSASLTTEQKVAQAKRNVLFQLKSAMNRINTNRSLPVVAKELGKVMSAWPERSAQGLLLDDRFFQENQQSSSTHVYIFPTTLNDEQGQTIQVVALSSRKETALNSGVRDLEHVRIGGDEFRFYGRDNLALALEDILRQQRQTGFRIKQWAWNLYQGLRGLEERWKKSVEQAGQESPARIAVTAVTVLALSLSILTVNFPGVLASLLTLSMMADRLNRRPAVLPETGNSKVNLEREERIKAILMTQEKEAGAAGKDFRRQDDTVESQSINAVVKNMLEKLEAFENILESKHEKFREVLNQEKTISPSSNEKQTIDKRTQSRFRDLDQEAFILEQAEKTRAETGIREIRTRMERVLLFILEQTLLARKAENSLEQTARYGNLEPETFGNLIRLSGWEPEDFKNAGTFWLLETCWRELREINLLQGKYILAQKSLENPETFLDPNKLAYVKQDLEQALQQKRPYVLERMFDMWKYNPDFYPSDDENRDWKSLFRAILPGWDGANSNDLFNQIKIELNKIAPSQSEENSHPTAINPPQGRSELLRQWTLNLLGTQGLLIRKLKVGQRWSGITPEWYDRHVVVMEFTWIAALAALLVLPFGWEPLGWLGDWAGEAARTSRLANAWSVALMLFLFLHLDRVSSWLKLDRILPILRMEKARATPWGNAAVAALISLVTGLLWLSLPQNTSETAILATLASVLGFNLLHRQVNNSKIKIQYLTQTLSAYFRQNPGRFALGAGASAAFIVSALTGNIPGVLAALLSLAIFADIDTSRVAGMEQARVSSGMLQMEQENIEPVLMMESRKKLAGDAMPERKTVRVSAEISQLEYQALNNLMKTFDQIDSLHSRHSITLQYLESLKPEIAEQIKISLKTLNWELNLFNDLTNLRDEIKMKLLEINIRRLHAMADQAEAAPDASIEPDQIKFIRGLGDKISDQATASEFANVARRAAWRLEVPIIHEKILPILLKAISQKSKKAIETYSELEPTDKEKLARFVSMIHWINGTLILNENTKLFELKRKADDESSFRRNQSTHRAKGYNDEFDTSRIAPKKTEVKSAQEVGTKASAPGSGIEKPNRRTTIIRKKILLTLVPLMAAGLLTTAETWGATGTTGVVLMANVVISKSWALGSMILVFAGFLLAALAQKGNPPRDSTTNEHAEKIYAKLKDLRRILEILREADFMNSRPRSGRRGKDTGVANAGKKRIKSMAIDQDQRKELKEIIDRLHLPETFLDTPQVLKNVVDLNISLNEAVVLGEIWKIMEGRLQATTTLTDLSMQDLQEEIEQARPWLRALNINANDREIAGLLIGMNKNFTDKQIARFLGHDIAAPTNQGDVPDHTESKKRIDALIQTEELAEGALRAGYVTLEAYRKKGGKQGQALASEIEKLGWGYNDQDHIATILEASRRSLLEEIMKSLDVEKITVKIIQTQDPGVYAELVRLAKALGWTENENDTFADIRSAIKQKEPEQEQTAKAQKPNQKRSGSTGGKTGLLASSVLAAGLLSATQAWAGTGPLLSPGDPILLSLALLAGYIYYLLQGRLKQQRSQKAGAFKLRFDLMIWLDALLDASRQRVRGWREQLEQRPLIRWLIRLIWVGSAIGAGWWIAQHLDLAVQGSPFAAVLPTNDKSKEKDWKFDAKKFRQKSQQLGRYQHALSLPKEARLEQIEWEDHSFLSGLVLGQLEAEEWIKRGLVQDVGGKESIQLVVRVKKNVPAAAPAVQVFREIVNTRISASLDLLKLMKEANAFRVTVHCGERETCELNRLEIIQAVSSGKVLADEATLEKVRAAETSEDPAERRENLIKAFGKVRLTASENEPDILNVQSKRQERAEAFLGLVKNGEKILALNTDHTQAEGLRPVTSYDLPNTDKVVEGIRDGDLVYWEGEKDRIEIQVAGRSTQDYLDGLKEERSLSSRQWLSSADPNRKYDLEGQDGAYSAAEIAEGIKRGLIVKRSEQKSENLTLANPEDGPFAGQLESARRALWTKLDIAPDAVQIENWKGRLPAYTEIQAAVSEGDLVPAVTETGIMLRLNGVTQEELQAKIDAAREQAALELARRIPVEQTFIPLKGAQAGSLQPSRMEVDRDLRAGRLGWEQTERGAVVYPLAETLEAYQKQVGTERREREARFKKFFLEQARKKSPDFQFIDVGITENKEAFEKLAKKYFSPNLSFEIPRHIRQGWIVDWKIIEQTLVFKLANDPLVYYQFLGSEREKAAITFKSDAQKQLRYSFPLINAMELFLKEAPSKKPATASKKDKKKKSSTDFTLNRDETAFTIRLGLGVWDPALASGKLIVAGAMENYPVLLPNGALINFFKRRRQNDSETYLYLAPEIIAKRRSTNIEKLIKDLSAQNALIEKEIVEDISSGLLWVRLDDEGVVHLMISGMRPDRYVDYCAARFKKRAGTLLGPRLPGASIVWEWLGVSAERGGQIESIFGGLFYIFLFFAQFVQHGPPTLIPGWHLAGYLLGPAMVVFAILFLWHLPGVYGQQPRGADERLRQALSASTIATLFTVPLPLLVSLSVGLGNLTMLGTASGFLYILAIWLGAYFHGKWNQDGDSNNSQDPRSKKHANASRTKAEKSDEKNFRFNAPISQRSRFQNGLQQIGVAVSVLFQRGVLPAAQRTALPETMQVGHNEALRRILRATVPEPELMERFEHELPNVTLRILPTWKFLVGWIFGFGWVDGKPSTDGSRVLYVERGVLETFAELVQRPVLNTREQQAYFWQQKVLGAGFFVQSGRARQELQARLRGLIWQVRGDLALWRAQTAWAAIASARGLERALGSLGLLAKRSSSDRGDRQSQGTGISFGRLLTWVPRLLGPLPGLALAVKSWTQRFERQQQERRRFRVRPTLASSA